MMLSIIIPVYCVEDMLDRCLESIVSQSFTDFEVILVDDGSPDNCPKLCDDWAQKDARIRVIHKENGGLSDARNAGIEVAQGEYLTFVDSDDYLEPDTLQQVMRYNRYKRYNKNTYEDIDIIEYPIYRFYGSEKQFLLSFEEKVYHDMKDYWLKGQAYTHAYACNKIFKRSLFEQVRFPKGKKFEDLHTLPLLLRQARSVITIPQGLYDYCWNAGSITATANLKALSDLLEANLKAPWMDDRSYLHALNIQIDVYEQGGEVMLKDRKVNLSDISMTSTEKMKGRLVNLLGVKGVCQLFRFLHQIKKPRA